MSATGDTPNEVYQRLRSHLAYLKLAAAAEALPGQLEAARADGGVPTPPSWSGCRTLR